MQYRTKTISKDIQRRTDSGAAGGRGVRRSRLWAVLALVVCSAWVGGWVPTAEAAAPSRGSHLLPRQLRNLSPELLRQMTVFQRSQYDKALSLLKKGETEAAVNEFDKFLTQFKGSPATGFVLYQKAFSSYWGMNRFQAIKQFNEVLDFFPSDLPAASPALFYMGLAHIENGDIANGMKLFKEMVDDEDYKKDPLAAKALLHLSTNAVKNKDIPLAVALWKRAASEYSSRMRYWHFRGTDNDSGCDAENNLLLYFFWRDAYGEFLPLSDAWNTFDWKLAKSALSPSPSVAKGEDMWGARRTVKRIDLLVAWISPISPHEFYLDISRNDPAANELLQGDQKKEMKRPKLLMFMKQPATQAVYKKAGMRTAYNRHMIMVLGPGKASSLKPFIEDLLAEAKEVVQEAKANPKEPVDMFRFSKAIAKIPVGDGVQTAAYRLAEVYKSLPTETQRSVAIHDLAMVMPNKVIWDAIVSQIPHRGVQLWDIHLMYAQQWMFGKNISGEGRKKSMKCLDEIDTMDKKMLDEINEITRRSHYIRLVVKKDLPRHRGDLLQLMGQYKKAIAAYRQWDTPGSGLGSIVQCYRKLGDQKKVIETLSEIQNMFPESAAKAAWDKARYYLKPMGDKKMAAASARYIMKAYPSTEYASKAHQMLEDLGLKSGGGVID
jgi:tetratricopeptide (TPR) repeat protein